MLSFNFLRIIGFITIPVITYKIAIMQRIKNKLLFIEYKKYNEHMAKNKSKIIVINISPNKSFIYVIFLNLVIISPDVLEVITFKGRLKI